MNMQITQNHVVTLKYHVSDKEGQVIDAGAQPIVYLHGRQTDIFPKLEQALEGKTVGDEVELTLEPEDAFGHYDENMTRVESLDVLPPGCEVGTEIQGNSEDGHQAIFVVVKIENGLALIDANHPLAGVSIVFKCSVLSVRPASAEELDHGHVHGEGGHHH
jgi:FKBP-type peptidyl-prolyl cis-trans isomerase SlyD